MELLIFCVSSDGHSVGFVQRQRWHDNSSRMPILLHKLPSLVTQTPHDMISDRLLPRMVLHYMDKWKEK